MRFYIATLGCALSLAAAILTMGYGVEQAAAADCTEDSACWVWSTMGNHQRGWVDNWGNPRHGGPCRFARALKSGNIFEYRATQRMRGDYTALRIAGNRGCI